MTEHTEDIKQEIVANVIKDNNLNPEEVKCNWRYDEETDSNWLSLYIPHTVKSSSQISVKKKKVSKSNFSIIKSLGGNRYE